MSRLAKLTAALLRSSECQVLAKAWWQATVQVLKSAKALEPACLNPDCNRKGEDQCRKASMHIHWSTEHSMSLSLPMSRLAKLTADLLRSSECQVLAQVWWQATVPVLKSAKALDPARLNPDCNCKEEDQCRKASMHIHWSTEHSMSLSLPMSHLAKLTAALPHKSLRILQL